MDMWGLDNNLSQGHARSSSCALGVPEESKERKKESECCAYPLINRRPPSWSCRSSNAVLMGYFPGIEATMTDSLMRSLAWYWSSATSSRVCEGRRELSLSRPPPDRVLTHSVSQSGPGRSLVRSLMLNAHVAMIRILYSAAVIVMGKREGGISCSFAERERKSQCFLKHI